MSLLEQLQQLEKGALESISNADSLAAAKELQVKYLGRKGPVFAALKSLGKLPAEERKEAGARANKLRMLLEAKIGEADYQGKIRYLNSII